MLWLCKGKQHENALAIVHIWHLTILINYHKSTWRNLKLEYKELNHWLNMEEIKRIIKLTYWVLDRVS